MLSRLRSQAISTYGLPQPEHQILDTHPTMSSELPGHVAHGRTVLKGEASTFSLELPPYRPPRILQTLYTSLIDRTLFVLWRAIVVAAPAGAVIWILGNVYGAECHCRIRRFQAAAVRSMR